jgi:hypothetical protein
MLPNACWAQSVVVGINELHGFPSICIANTLACLEILNILGFLGRIGAAHTPMPLRAPLCAILLRLTTIFVTVFRMGWPRRGWRTIDILALAGCRISVPILVKMVSNKSIVLSTLEATLHAISMGTLWEVRLAALENDVGITTVGSLEEHHLGAVHSRGGDSLTGLVRCRRMTAVDGAHVPVQLAWDFVHIEGWGATYLASRAGPLAQIGHCVPIDLCCVCTVRQKALAHTLGGTHRFSGKAEA